MLKRLSKDDTYSMSSSCGEDTVILRKCIISGYFDHAAQLGNDGKYCTVRGRIKVAVHSSSVLARYGAPPEWVVFNDMVHTKDALIRDVTKIDPRWLLEIAPHYYTRSKT
jgi:ATP-dependent RNA helicase DDX35